MILRSAFHVPSEWPNLGSVLQLSQSDVEHALLALLPDSERVRIMSLRRLEDRRRAIVGRLLLRKTCCELQSASWNDIFLGRDASERPYVAKKGDIGTRIDELDVNASHHGDWVVVAGHRSKNGQITYIGVDVMTVDEIPGGGSVDELLESMKDLVRLSSDNGLQTPAFGLQA
jgi:phosphopantetheinyl transferase